MDAPSIRELERLIGRALGREVRIARAERPGPWAVMRCALEPAGADLPASVVVKWLRDDPNGLRADLRQVADEQAALEFLAEIGFPHAPRLIGADRTAGVVVLEDLSPRASLAEKLRREGAEACAGALMAFAAALGALGAATVGRSAAYDAIRGRYGAPDPSIGRARGLGPRWPQTRRLLEDHGLAMRGDAERDLAETMEALLDPGPFLALTNGDAAANNFLVGAREEEGRLIDFEFAAYRQALTCAVCLHLPGSAWITVAHPINAGLEAAYRKALAVGVPEAEDDRLFGRGLAAACLAEALDRLNRFAVLDRRAPGHPSRVQMVSTLEAAAQAAQAHRALPHLAGWASRIGEWLRRRWRDADVDLASYPAYAPRQGD